MKVYISEVPKDYDNSGCFEYRGRFYYYELSLINESDLAIKDSCGRFMPLSFRDTINLGKAISAIAPVVNALAQAEEALDYISNNTVVCI